MASSGNSTRREFLQGRSALDALLDWTGGEGDSGDPSSLRETGAPRYITRFKRRAMACDFEVLLSARRSSEATEAAVAALDLVDLLEAQMTVFRDDSEIAWINREAAAEPVAVESRLFALLRLAADLHEQTGGALDITAGPLSSVWGFSRRQGMLPTPAAIDDALARVGMRHLHLDDADETARFGRDGIELNLGSIGKGYALDRCAELLTQRGVTDFLLHGGKSSILGRGSEADDGWIVGVGHPMRPGRRIATIRLRDGALGTSGSGAQSFRHAGRRYGHILDPRTGWPAEGVLSATVFAPDAATADALATAMYVMGPQRARELCQRRHDVAALLICPGPSEGAVTVCHENFGDRLELVSS